MCAIGMTMNVNNLFLESPEKSKKGAKGKREREKERDRTVIRRKRQLTLSISIFATVRLPHLPLEIIQGKTN